MLKRSFQFNFPAVKEEKTQQENPYKKLHEELAEIGEALSANIATARILSEFEDVYQSTYAGLTDDMQELLDDGYYKATIQQQKDSSHLLEEVLDLYHATETLLRTFDAAEVFDMRNRVIEKNAKRGYYEED